MHLIYLDNAATTPVDSRVLLAMKPYFSSKFGNASEYHRLGMEAREAIESARNSVAVFLGAVSPEEIIFTGSATESINLSHKGLIEALQIKSNRSKPHIVTSSIEHKAVLETCSHLESLGMAEVTYLPVDSFGRISLESIKNAITSKTALVSIMYVNNEVGTIEPIQKIGDLIKRINKTRAEKPVYFHTDATQAIQYLPCDVESLGVDLLSVTGHKVYAPKGVGILYKRKELQLVRQMDGGVQESGLRSSTENVPYIVGIGIAISMIEKRKEKSKNNIEILSDILIKGILKIPGVILTGHPRERVAHIASFIVDGAEGEALILSLSNLGVMASSGSACTASDLAPSHVLTAMGISPENSHGSIRFSLGKDTTKKEIDFVLNHLPKIIRRLRRMAPKF